MNVSVFSIVNALASVLVSAAAASASCPAPIPMALPPEASANLRSFALSPSALDVFPDADILSDSLPLLAQYRAWATPLAGMTDPILLLKRQRTLYARVIPQEVPRFDVLIDGRAGKIGEMSCLEATLLEEHLKFGFEKKRETEFGAYVLDCGSELRARFQTSDQAGVSTDRVVQALVVSDLAEGCVLRAHLHNHPFDFKNHYGDIAGTVIPSAPDMQTYRNLRATKSMQEARLTNGFSTLILQSAEFDEL